jgi:hypothetical protein
LSFERAEDSFIFAIGYFYTKMLNEKSQIIGCLLPANFEDLVQFRVLPFFLEHSDSLGEENVHHSLDFVISLKLPEQEKYKNSQLFDSLFVSQQLLY